jgi:peptidoglycan/xylan/chitin deacetylase (PgdA/CDA1 family)
MPGKPRPKILFTIDFDADMDSDEHPLAGWRWLADEAFNKRDDFRAVVNLVGLGLKRIITEKELFKGLKKLVDNGRVFIGNHSWDHPSFTGAYTSTPSLSRAEQADQLLITHEFIAEHLGEPIFFRAPFFDHDHNTLQLVAQLGIRYDLSQYIARDELKPVKPYEYFLPTREILVRIDTNLKLSPLEWIEPIASWDGEPLVPGGLYNIIVHPREFSEPEQADEIQSRLKLLLASKVDLIGPEEIEQMLEEED